MKIYSLQQIDELKKEVVCNLEKSKTELQKIISNEDVLQALAQVKFAQVAFDPIKGTPLNFIEALNQTYSDLVVLYAAENLTAKYPGKSFIVRLGAQSGHDIESEDGEIVGECFSVTKMKSNDKLKKDTERLMKLGDDIEKYIFFYSDQDSDKSIDNFAQNHPEIIFVRIKKFEIE